MLSYWRWLLRGSGGKPGLAAFLDAWLVVHLGLGLALAVFVPASLSSAATSVLLPLVAAIIGLSFAWGGNAQALMATEEIEALSEHSAGGLEEFVYSFQTAILVLMVTLVAWSLAGLGVFDEVWPGEYSPRTLLAVKWVIYVLTSLSVREGWGVVIGAQALALARNAIRRSKRRDENRIG